MKKVLLLAMLSLTAPGCVRSSQVAGVKNKWREPIAEFKTGETTQSEVLHALGPPSQVISLQDQIVFYYLLEESKVRGVVLIVYNDVKVHIRYDRAIFFFDKEGRLTDYAYSDESAPIQEKKK